MKMILYALFFIIPSVFTAKIDEINGDFKIGIFDESGIKYSENNLTHNFLWIQFNSVRNPKYLMWLRIKRKKMNDYSILVKSMKRESINLNSLPQSADCHFFTATHLMTHQHKLINKSAQQNPLLRTNEHSQEMSLSGHLHTRTHEDLSFANNNSQDVFRLVTEAEDVDDVSGHLPISLCHGLSGIASLRGDQHLVKIEPVSEVFLDIVRLTKIPKLPATNINDLEGYDQLKLGADAAVRQWHKRVKRSFKMPVHNMQGPFLVELYLIVDSKMAEMYRGNSYSRLLSRIKSIMNQINVIFMQFNIYFTVVQLEIWEHDQIKLTDENHILMELQLYKRQFVNKRHDCLHAILGENLGSARRGQSEPASMCSFNRCVAYTKDYGALSELEIAHSVMHEIGHNFGLSHDTEKCHCFGCIMATGVEFGSSKFQWSNCSKKEISGLLNSGMSDCLLDGTLSELGDFYPVIMSRNKESKKLELISLSLCGNGVVDEGEQCDCGGRALCSAAVQRCCDPDTCRLTSWSSCASGACCDLKSCSVKFAGTICRSTDYKDCDLPEYCDGVSEWCPANVYKYDGVPCKTDVGDWSHCYHGQCHSRISFCRVLFGFTGKEASRRCYEMNKIGNEIKNCGLDIPIKDDRYRQPKNWNTRACNDENVQCGRLWCSHENERVLRLSPQIEIEEMVQGYQCSAARFYLDWFLDDAGLVPNGSPCGYGKMCWRGACIHSVYNDMGGCYCHGHGVCNNRGHCHCDPGFAAPNCTSLGDGGSIDSGPLRGFHNKWKAIIAGVFIFLVAVLTILALVTLIYHYNTRRWPSLLAKIKWPHYKKSESELESKAPNKFENDYAKITRPTIAPLKINNHTKYVPQDHHQSPLYSPTSPTPILTDELIYANIVNNTSPPLQKNTKKPSSIKSKAKMFDKVIEKRTTNFQNPQLKVHKLVCEENSKIGPTILIREEKKSPAIVKPSPQQKPPLLIAKPAKPILSTKPEVAKKPYHSTIKPPLISEKPPKTIVISKPAESSSRYALKKFEDKSSKGSGPRSPISPSAPSGPTDTRDHRGPTGPTDTRDHRGPTGPTDTRDRRGPTGPTGPTDTRGPTGPTPSKDKPVSSSKKGALTKTSKAEISQPRLDQTTCTAKTCDLPSTDQTLSRTVGPHKILKVDPHKAVKYLY